MSSSSRLTFYTIAFFSFLSEGVSSVVNSVIYFSIESIKLVVICLSRAGSLTISLLTRPNLTLTICSVGAKCTSFHVLPSVSPRASISAIQSLLWSRSYIPSMKSPQSSLIQPTWESEGNFIELQKFYFQVLVSGGHICLFLVPLAPKTKPRALILYFDLWRMS